MLLSLFSWNDFMLLSSISVPLVRVLFWKLDLHAVYCTYDEKSNIFKGGFFSRRSSETCQAKKAPLTKPRPVRRCFRVRHLSSSAACYILSWCFGDYWHYWHLSATFLVGVLGATDTSVWGRPTHNLGLRCLENSPMLGFLRKSGSRRGVLQ